MEWSKRTRRQSIASWASILLLLVGVLIGWELVSQIVASRAASATEVIDERVQIPPVPEMKSAIQTLTSQVGATSVQTVSSVQTITPAPAKEPVAVTEFDYTVVEGDNLTKLALRFGEGNLNDTIRAIAARNGIQNIHLIRVGQVLVLKRKQASPETIHNASPGEFGHEARASQEKPIVSRPETQVSQTPVRITVGDRAKPGPEKATPSRSRSRTAAVRGHPLTQNVEPRPGTLEFRRELLAKLNLPDPDCLYAKDQGRSHVERVKHRISCIHRNYGEVIRQAAQRTGVDHKLILAVMWAESGGRPDAISPTGCSGVMQFTKRTAKKYELHDRFEPIASIHKGAELLRDNIRNHRDNVAKGVSDYNGSSVRQAYTATVMQIYRLIQAHSS